MKNEKLVGRKNAKNSRFEFNLINRLNKDLSAELHDNVSSQLSIMRLKLAHSPSEITEAIQLLDSIIGSVRKISHGLYSPAIEHLDFIDSVRDFLSPLHTIINVRIHNIHSRNCGMNGHRKLFLFRIFQEVINNILKHSNATKISVYIRSSTGSFNFLIKDNGNGFLDNLSVTEGIGLKNIKYRACELQAKYKFKNLLNRGTSFIISVPIL